MVDVAMVAISGAVLVSVLVVLWRRSTAGFTNGFRVEYVLTGVSLLLLLPGGILSRDFGRIIAIALLLTADTVLLAASLWPTGARDQ